MEHEDEDACICGDCQISITNYANMIDSYNFQNHVIEEATTEDNVTSPYVFPTLVVQLRKDTKLDILCEVFKRIKKNKGKISKNSKGNVKNQNKNVHLKSDNNGTAIEINDG